MFFSLHACLCLSLGWWESGTGLSNKHSITQYNLAQIGMLEKLFRFPRKKTTYRILEIQMLILDDLWVDWMLFSMFVPVLISE